MKITLDADEASQTTRRLNDAASVITHATPTVSNYATFGPAVLGSAVATFVNATTSEVASLQSTWSSLGENVTATLNDFAQVESAVKSTISRHGVMFK